MSRFVLSLMISMASCVCSAQSLWVGAVTGTNKFNFTPGYVGGEFTDLGSTSELAFYDHSASDSLSTLDLILGFVSPPATPPTITGVKVYTGVGNVDGSNNISSGPGTPHAVSLSPTGPTLLSSGKANAVLSMPGLSDSESTSNYDMAEIKDGITPTGGYALYVYDLSAYASSFSGYALLDITFGAAVAKGTVAFGWGCGGAGCSADYTSVATQGGFVSGGTVPEATSVTLLATVSAIALGLWRRKSRRPFTA